MENFQYLCQHWAWVSHCFAQSCEAIFAEIQSVNDGDEQVLVFGEQYASYWAELRQLRMKLSHELESSICTEEGGLRCE
jgi:hypothetical protein